MTSTLRIINRITQNNPAVTCILIALATLAVDFVTGRSIRFPLVYLLPIGIAAWVGEKKLAYALSVLLPLVRVVFEVLWDIPELLLIESLNTAIEVLALVFYVYFLGLEGTQTRKMEKAITTKDEEMQHLRAFTRMVGRTLQGRAISPGLVDGVATLYLPENEVFFGKLKISRDDVESEVNRLDSALAASIRELENVRERFDRRMSDEEIALVEVHQAMLSDPSLAERCRRRVREDLVKAEKAVVTEVRDIEARILELKQEYMRERSADVRDIGRRVLRNLRNPEEGTPHLLASLPPETILVAEELLLSDFLQMDPINVAAIVTEKTGPASHVAILARARQIPAVCDIKDATLLLASGDRLLVDAEVGTVTVSPTQVQASRFGLRKTQSNLSVTAPLQKDVPPCVTKDGVAIGLHANISRPDEAAIILEFQLDGVGLFRSEFLFLNVAQPPDLETQTAAYSEVAAMLDPLPIVIRTMDLGGDKLPLFDRIGNEMAFRTGLRGLAYSLNEKTLFRTQLQAILRASQVGNVRIMFPMVMGVADLREARRLVDEVCRTEQLSERPPIGAMIETPSAVFAIEGILDYVDFVCIGTNDLAHFILAMERGAQGNSEVLPFLHPSVLRATEQIIGAATRRGVTVSVCGEAAGDPAVACLMVGMGVRDLSMNPFLSVHVRHAICQLKLDRARIVAEEVLHAATPGEVQEIIASARREISV
jgi:phosphoenolpyruvate-protein phosphotransferase (PTS system enzyme I)